MQLSNLHTTPQLFIKLSFESQKSILEQAGIPSNFTSQLTSFFQSGMSGWDRRRANQKILFYSNQQNETLRIETK